MHPNRNIPLFWLGAIAALGICPLAAQQMPAADAQMPNASEKKDLPPIELSPFVVSSDQDVGYLAGSTLAGSRMNTALKDTAASIEIFTPEFMKDIGAFSLAEVMAYGNNIAYDQDEEDGGGNNGNASIGNFTQYRVRGQNSTQARNYFSVSNLPVDIFNVGRVEQSRGPNAVLFGIGSPSGVINIATKEAMIGRSFQNLSLMAGSYDSWRGSLDANQTLSKKAAVRVNLTDSHLATDRYFTGADGRRGALAATYRVLPKVELRGEFETGTLRDNPMRSDPLIDVLVPWINAGRPLYSLTDVPPGGSTIGGRINLTTVSGASIRYIQNPGQAAGQLINMGPELETRGVAGLNFPLTDRSLMSPRVNPQGPDADRHFHYKTMSVFADVQIAKNIFLQAGYNHLDDNRTAWNNSGENKLFGDANTTLPGTLGANPYAGRLFQQVSWMAYDSYERYDRGRVAISAEHDFGKWGLYRLAVNGEMDNNTKVGTQRVEAFTGRPFNTTPENSANLLIRRTYVTEGQWDSYYVRGVGNMNNVITNVTDPVTGRTFSTSMIPTALTSVPTTQEGLLAAMQALYFKGRLVIGGGVRRDTVSAFSRATKRDPVTNVIEEDAAHGVPLGIGANSTSFGAVAHVTKNLDLIYSHSNNFNIPNTTVYAFTGSGLGPNSFALMPPPKGEGNEYGIAFSLPGNRLYAKLVHFTNVGKNVLGFSNSQDAGTTNVRILDALLANGLITQSAYDAHGGTTPVNGYLLDRTDDGYELSVTANLTPNWRFQANYSINNPNQANNRASDLIFWTQAKAYFAQFPQTAMVVGKSATIAQDIANTDLQIATAQALNGVGVDGFRKYKANVFTRYSFRNGFLKNSYIGGGYLFASQMLIGRTGTYNMYGGKTGSGSALAGYRLKLSDKHAVDLQLNVANVFNDIEPIIYKRNLNTNGQLFKPTHYQWPTPRTWRLTADYAF